MRFFFHATDGYDMLIDRSGQRLLGRPFEAVAGEVAASIRSRFGPGIDLGEWGVTVQDEIGVQVDVYGFAELRGETEALVAA